MKMSVCLREASSVRGGKLSVDGGPGGLKAMLLMALNPFGTMVASRRAAAVSAPRAGTQH